MRPLAAMVARGGVFFWALLLLLAALLPGAASPAVGASAPVSRKPASLGYVQVVRQDADGVEARIRIPAGLIRIHDQADGTRSVEIDGLDPEPLPGAPELPVLVLSIGVPEGADVRLHHTVGAELAFPGGPVRPVEQHAEDSHEYLRVADEAIYAEPGIWPEERLQLELLRYRELRVARVLVRPVRFDRTTGEVRVTHSIDLRLDFEGCKGFPRVSGPAAGTAKRMVSQNLLNGSTVKAGWAASPEPKPAGRIEPREPQAPAGTAPGVRIYVDTEDLIRVTRNELNGIGYPVGAVDPRNLQMSYRGEPIPCRVIGEADGSFDSGDAIEFYGFPGTTRYAAESVFWLSEEAGPGLRFPTRSAPPGSAPVPTAFPHTIHYEPKNGIYSLGKPAEEGDPHFFWAWFEDNPNPPRVTFVNHSATLPGVTTGFDSTFRALFYGRTNPIVNPDHHVRFRVNGTIVGETQWNGQTFNTAEIPFDSALLGSGSNTFRMEYQEIAFPDIYYLDWVEIVYPRSLTAVSNRLPLTSPGGLLRFNVTGFTGVQDPLVLDVTNPLAPVRIVDFTTSGAGPFTIAFEDDTAVGERFQIAGDNGRASAALLELDTPSNLRDTANAADLLIITPRGWEGNVGGLVTARQADGLRVRVTNLEDVADEFAGGNEDDVAIRDFVTYAYHNWEPPALSYLLLVGESSLDPQNWLERTGHAHLMPTHFTVTVSQGETISDTWFGSVDGDLLPEVGVGRISVDAPVNLTRVLNKILNYESIPTSRRWLRNVIHVASDEIAFEESLEAVQPIVPSNYTVVEEYRRLGANATTIAAEINNGGALLSFLGHGNVGFWADGGGGPYWEVADVNALSNTDRPTFVSAMNCLNGLIADPFQTTSLSEAFANKPFGGAIGMWSPSALGFLSQYDRLRQTFYPILFQDHTTDMGTATTTALVEAYLTQPVSLDLVKEMILLADPSWRLPVICEATVDDNCDGLDDDCDGVPDDDFAAEPTSCGEGACASSGAMDCVDGQVMDTCSPGSPSPEVCDGGIDNDCNGLPDDDEHGVETDGDGLNNACDNCPLISNAGQEDFDADEIGDVCDDDDDNDGVVDEADCQPFNTSLAGAPGSVGNSLRMAQDGSTELRWGFGEQAHTTNVYRGEFGNGSAWSYDVACLYAEVAAHSAVDEEVPVSGGFFYLISSRNQCGESPMGVNGDGIDLFPTSACASLGADGETDGVVDLADNCATVQNADQADGDQDFVGNACDVCPNVFDPLQLDLDEDGEGDACDACTDRDGDGFGDPGFPASTCPIDNCPPVSNPTQTDADQDGQGDVCDACPLDPANDADGDTLCESVDNCDTISNSDQKDTDADGLGDACDSCTDRDGDSFGDPGFPQNTCADDNCPMVANLSQLDSDGDGAGDLCDPCPNDAANDQDLDNVCGDIDNCPATSNPTQTDSDGDDIGDDCDACVNNPDTGCVACPPGTDDDGDGVCNADAELVGFGGTMRYLANTSDPGVDGSWMLADFDDSTWSTGTFGVGYENVTGAEALIQTEVAVGTYSVYTRATFDIADAAAVVRLLLGADWDDGFAAWLNGVPIHRSEQLPDGNLAWNTNSIAHESSNDPTPDYGTPIDLAGTGIPLLVNGENVLAVGVWNALAATSGDLVLVPRLTINGAAFDNCPGVANPGQGDSDGDGVGDACQGGAKLGVE